MPSIPFWKLQAIGNDFPLFHAADVADLDLAQLAIQAANRSFGIGGDGILVLSPQNGDVVLRMFNPDGTEDFCGNGLRIAARHAVDQGWVQDKFTIWHLGHAVPAEVSSDGTIRTTIGVADYAPAKVPLIAEEELFDGEIGLFSGKVWRGSSLTTGSTHTIIPVDTLPSDAEIADLGPQIEYAPQFPDRTSVIFVKEVAPNELQIRIWERGVGETLGCGTGSSAAAADHLRRLDVGQGRRRVIVRNPGGTIAVSMDAWDAPITVEGAAVEVYSGSFDVDNS